MKQWLADTPGIPDENFLKNDSPITKEEIRAVVIAKLRLQKTHRFLDVGAGTGSVTIEASRFLTKGLVYAVEALPPRVALIKENITRLKATRIQVIEGFAPQVMEGLPPMDRIFIGGSGGKLPEILAKCATLLAKDGRLVMTAVTLESLETALKILNQAPFVDFEAIALNVAHLKTLQGLHLFQPEHTVHVLAAAVEKER